VDPRSKAVSANVAQVQTAETPLVSVGLHLIKVSLIAVEALNTCLTLGLMTAVTLTFTPREKKVWPHVKQRVCDSAVKDKSPDMNCACMDG